MDKVVPLFQFGTEVGYYDCGPNSNPGEDSNITPDKFLSEFNQLCYQILFTYTDVRVIHNIKSYYITKVIAPRESSFRRKVTAENTWNQRWDFMISQEL